MTPSMVPWPIALLTLLYGVIAAISSATAWKILSGASGRSVLWPVTWLALSAGAMCGLPLLKPWARRAAIATSTLLAVATLAIAGVLVAAHRPIGALLATISVSVHVLSIRYLQRPAIKAYFGLRNATLELNNS